MWRIQTQKGNKCFSALAFGSLNKNKGHCFFIYLFISFILFFKHLLPPHKVKLPEQHVFLPVQVLVKHQDTMVCWLSHDPSIVNQSLRELQKRHRLIMLGTKSTIPSEQVTDCSTKVYASLKLETRASSHLPATSKPLRTKAFKKAKNLKSRWWGRVPYLTWKG